MLKNLMRRVLASSLSVALLASVSACADPSQAKDLGGDPAFQKFYSQQINWQRCGDFDCAKVEVPMNWNDPNSKSIQIAVNRKTSFGATRNLMVNPGGPGASGVDFVANNYDYIGSAEMRKKFNLIGFDPRGTGDSSPVKCLNAKDTDYLLYGQTDAPIGSAEELKLQRKETAKFVAACEKNTGEVLGYLDTVSAAKDIDVIRVALGEETLDYLGYSYGTFLGTTYASLFPDRVGRFVLDGAIDPRVSDAEQSVNQIKGFDLAITDFLKWCLKQNNCPFTGSVTQARKQLADKLRYMETNTVPTQSGRELTLAGLDTGLIMGLYSDTYWSYLLQGFNELEQGDGSLLLRLADSYNDRNEDGTYSSNTLEANIAISCLDARQPADSKSMKAQNQRMLDASSVLGRYWQNGALLCAQWPYPVAQRPSDYSAKGSPTIVVIGTTGDPATPYGQAVGLAHEVLDKGFLITFEGEGHTAYGRSNSCVDNKVDDFLLNGNLPDREPTC